MLSRALPLVSPKLLPIQLGISVSARTEKIFHKVCSQLNTAAPDHQNLLLLDLKNAFNSIERSAILDAIYKYCPMLLRWFAWSYGVPSKLSFGEFTVLSKQGVQQGDPLGSFLFAISIQDCIMAVHSLPGVVWSGWYADDGTIQAPLPILDRALAVLATSLSACNIAINPINPNIPIKSKIVTQSLMNVNL